MSSYIQMTLRLGFILCRWPVIRRAPPPGLRDPPGSRPFTRDDFGGGPASLGGGVSRCPGRAGSCVSFSSMPKGCFYPFPFPLNPESIFWESREEGVREEEPQGTQTLATANVALICRRNPQDSFSTKWLQRKSCPANDKGGNGVTSSAAARFR